MKIRYPQAGIAAAAAAVLAGVCVLHAYALPDPAEPAAPVEAQQSETLWKAEISDYDSSLSLVQYEEVTPSEEEVAAMQDATTQRFATLLIPSAGLGSINIGAAPSLAETVEPGQFAFTTYGYGHGVGMSQNGANLYATYGGYDYLSILFHYYPGTTLVQEDPNTTITANGVTGSLLEILSQIVYNEMSSTMHPEAMKAQTVAAYSYIMYNGGSVNNVILKPDPPQNVIDAVSSVLGQALYYEDSYALTVYGASSGGATANSGDVWGTQYDYLVSVPCEYDAEFDPNYGLVTYLSVDEVRAKLQKAYNIALSDNVTNWIQLELGESGYVRSVTIDGQKTVTGNSFRGALGLRSARFAYVCG